MGDHYPGFNDQDGSIIPYHVTFASGASGAGSMVGNGSVWFVDGDKSTSGNGKSWTSAFATIQEGVTAASAHDTVYVVAKTLTDYTGDPTSYAETVIIPYATSSLALIGISRGRTQGGLPQIKKGSGTTALLTVRAPGCLIANMGFNGVDSTGGGILLDDDNATKSAFGTTIANCHFKNCKTHATQGKTGGAIYTTTAGNAWQCLISGCRFYKNVTDIALVGTTTSRPQDWVIEDCDFSGYAAYTDCNIWGTGTGSGFGSIKINNCRFGQLPAIGSGNIGRYFDLTGTLSGTITNCTFGCNTGNSGTTITFLAAGTGGKLPVTVHMMRCYGQSETATETGEITIGANS